MSRNAKYRAIPRDYCLAPLLFAALALGACDRQATDPSEIQSLQTQPDFTIDSVWYTVDGTLDDLDTATFHVRIRNLGGVMGGPASVVMYVDSQFEGYAGIEHLAASGDTTVSFKWAASAEVHEFLFGVDHPPEDTVAEANEANNTLSFQLTVPYRVRSAVDTDTIVFSDISLTIRSDSLVQQVLQVLADSGHVLATNAPTIRTQYDQDQVTTYITPVGAWNQSADSTPILMIVSQPTAQGTLNMPFIFQLGDSLTYSLYDGRGGVRVLDGGATIVDFETAAVGPLNALLGEKYCSERAFWACLKAGFLGAACVINIIAAVETPTVATVLAAFRICSVALASGGKCIDALTDNPPKIYFTGYPRRSCEKCVGRDLVEWKCEGAKADVGDDRRPKPTFQTAQSWTPPCNNPGSYTFVATDCGGNVTARSVDAVISNLRTHLNHPKCAHNQGGGS